MEEKKIENIRAMMQERVKALRGKQANPSANKQPLAQSRFKEILDKAKQKRTEKTGTTTVPVSFGEKMLARIEELKKQQLNNKEEQS